MVHTSASAISLPMLEVPGWLESHRLPNAVAVVMAENTTARVRLDCSSAVFPTSSFSNPTHTLIALAVRVGEHLQSTRA